LVKYPQGNPFKNLDDTKKSIKNTEKKDTIQSIPTSCSSSSPSSSASVHSSPISSCSNTTNELTLHKSDENINEKVGVDLGNLNTESNTDSSSPATSSSSKSSSSSSSANQDEAIKTTEITTKKDNCNKTEPIRISRQERDKVMQMAKKLNSKELVRQLSLSRLNEDIKLEIPRTFTLKKRMHKELLEKLSFIDKDSSSESSITSSQDTISFHQSSPLSQPHEKHEIKRKISKIHVKLNENTLNNKHHAINGISSDNNDEEDYVIEYVTLNEYSEIPNLNGHTAKMKKMTKTLAIINVNEENDTSLLLNDQQKNNKNLTEESLPLNDSIQLINQDEDEENGRSSLSLDEKQQVDETIDKEDDEMLLDKEVIENMKKFRIDENMINMSRNQNGCEMSSDEDLKSISSIEGSLKGISSKLALAYENDENCKIDDPKNKTSNNNNNNNNNKFNHSSSTPLIYLYPNLGNHNHNNINIKNNSNSHNNHNSYINLYLKLK
jgi:hypothetical protein